MNRAFLNCIFIIFFLFSLSGYGLAKGSGYRSSRSHSSYRSSGGYHSTRSYKGSTCKTRTYNSNPQSGRSYHSYSYSPHRSNYHYGVNRDRYGRIERNSSAKNEFMRQTGYPKGRPGYVVDHVVPLKRGGGDTPSNMQWQTKEAVKAKDKWE
jgi:hypothetical protein